MNAFDIAEDNALFAGRELSPINWDSVPNGPEVIDDFIFRHSESDAEIDAEPMVVEPVDDLFTIRQKRVERMAAVMPSTEREQESFLLALERQGKQLVDFA